MLLKDIFSASAIAMDWNMYVEEKGLPPYLGEALFPSQKKAGLDLSWIKGKNGLPISLAPSNFDALANIRDRISVDKLETEMPFFRDSFMVTEKDRQEILRVQESTDPYAKAVLGHIYDDSRNLVNGANVVPERMRMQLLAPVSGNLGISISADGVTYSYNYDPDGEWKKSNYLELSTATDKWSDTVNSDPFKDIEDAQDAIQTGDTPSVLVISKATMRLLRNNEKLKAYVLSKSVNSQVYMTSKMVADHFKEELGIKVIVNDKKYKAEDGTVKKFYPDGYATLIPAGELGSTYYGTSPEEADLLADSNADVQIVNTGVAVAVVHKQHPVNAQVIASEIVLPSFERMDSMYVIKHS